MAERRVVLRSISVPFAGKHHVDVVNTESAKSFSPLYVHV